MTEAAPTTSPQELLSELLRRKQAQEGLADYIAYCELGFVPAEHHRLLIEHLERVDRGEIKRLMVFMPPGSAKTTYASALFPSWYFGRHPENSVIFASHTEELATTIGRRVRNIVASPEHHKVFGGGLADDRKGIGAWETDKGGQYFAVGIGGAVSGRRADLLLIDDPVRSREAADSERDRWTTWEWWQNDALPRLKPNGAIVVIQTRWHLDDLAGRLLEQQPDQWTVLSLPMEAVGSDDPLGRRPGERLWPDWFTQSMVDQAKRDPRGWNSLYQQNPAPDEGTYFHADWFGNYRRLPEQMSIYGASDFAVTSNSGDYTVHLVAGRDPLNNIYLVDAWIGQAAPDIWIDRLLDLVMRYRPLCWFGEAGPIRRSIEPFLRERMGERSAWARVEWLPSTADKEARCRAFQGLASMGKILLPIESRWKAEVLGQLLRFPADKFDDIVDACSLLGRGLEKMPAPSALAAPGGYGTPTAPSRHLIEFDPFKECYAVVGQERTSGGGTHTYNYDPQANEPIDRSRFANQIERLKAQTR